MSKNPIFHDQTKTKFSENFTISTHFWPIFGAAKKNSLFWIKNFEILAFSQNPIFHDQNFFLQKNFLVVKNRVLGKFFKFWPEIFQKQQILKTLKFFSELQIYLKTCNWHILNKNTPQKNSRAQRVNVQFKCDYRLT